MMHNRVALIGVLCTVAACTSVRPIHPTAYLEVNAPPVVWVTYDNNPKVVVIAEPEVRRDTLRGTLEGTRVRIPLADIQTVQAKVRDHGKTALLVGSIGVAAVSALYVGLISQAGSSTGTGGEVVYCPVDVRGRATNFC
jgi:hypothetical protein